MAAFSGKQFVAEQSVHRLTGRPTGSWCVVNYGTGLVRYEALTRAEAERMADELNDEADDEGADDEGADDEGAEHFDFDHMHTTPAGRHFRHGDGAEMDGDGRVKRR